MKPFKIELLRLALLLVWSPIAHCYEAKKVLLKKFEQCLNGEKLPIVLSNFIIYQESKGQYYMKGVFNVKEDVPEKWAINAAISKCNDRHNLDSCEIYMDKLRQTDGCTVMAQLQDEYAPIFEALTPKMACPIKAGEYELKHCSLNSYLNAFISQGSPPTLLIKAEGFQGNKKLFCIESRLDITNRNVNITV